MSGSNFVKSSVGRYNAARPDAPGLTERCYEETRKDDRDPFNRDAQRLLHSTRLRRLQDKTEISFPTYGPHDARSALTVTTEVLSMVVSDCRMYGLNTDLALAISLAHSIATPPYGRFGERIISKCTGYSFNRAEMSLYMLSRTPMEYDHPGLNLTRAVRHSLMHLSESAPGGLHPDIPRDADLGLAKAPLTLESVLLRDYIPVTQAADYLEDCLTARFLPLEKLEELLALPIFDSFPGDKEKRAVESLRESARHGPELDQAHFSTVTKAVFFSSARALEKNLEQEFLRSPQMDFARCGIPRRTLELCEQLVEWIFDAVAKDKDYESWQKEIETAIDKSTKTDPGEVGSPMRDVILPSIINVLDSTEPFMQRVNYKFRQVMTDLVHAIDELTSKKEVDLTDYQRRTMQLIMKLLRYRRVVLIQHDESNGDLEMVRFSHEGDIDDLSLAPQERELLRRDLEAGTLFFGADAPWFKGLFGRGVSERSSARRLPPVRRAADSRAWHVLGELGDARVSAGGPPRPQDIEIENALARPVLELFLLGVRQIQSVTATLAARERVHEATAKRVDDIDKRTDKAVRNWLHEIKSPVGILQSSVNLAQGSLNSARSLLARGSGPEDQQWALQAAAAAKSASDSMECVVEISRRLLEVVDTVKSDVDRIFRTQRIDVSDVVSRSFRRQEGTFSVRFLGDRGLFAMANEYKLESIIDIFASNAQVHAFRDRPRSERVVWCRCMRGSGGDVVIDYWNNGREISRERAATIFNQFKPGDDKSGWQHGLWQVAEDVRKMRGTVECRAIPDRGDSLERDPAPQEHGKPLFRIILRGAESAAPPPRDAASAGGQAPLPLGPGRRSLTVLLADDEWTDVCDVFDALGERGATRLYANTVSEALEIVSSREIGSACVDLDFGGEQDGVDIVSAIRRKSPKTRVVVLTASQNSERRSSAMSAGAIAVYDKVGLDVDLLTKLLCADGASR